MLQNIGMTIGWRFFVLFYFIFRPFILFEDEIGVTRPVLDQSKYESKITFQGSKSSTMEVWSPISLFKRGIFSRFIISSFPNMLYFWDSQFTDQRLFFLNVTVKQKKEIQQDYNMIRLLYIVKQERKKVRSLRS